MTAATTLPPGVIAAGKPGTCARCGAKYSTGAHCRRYGTGLRPVACGCIEVSARSQTAPAQPTPAPTHEAAREQDDLASRLEQVTAELSIERGRADDAIADLTQAEHDRNRARHERDVAAADLHAERAAKLQWTAELEAVQADADRARTLRDEATAAQAAADRRHADLRKAVGQALGLTSAETHALNDEQLADAVRRVRSRLSDALSVQAPTAVPRAAERRTPPLVRDLRSQPIPPPPDEGRPPSYATPTTHVCAAAGCGHREKFHDEAGCDRRGCSCTAFERTASS